MCILNLPLEAGLVMPQVGWDTVSGYHQGRVISVSQIDGDSNMVVLVSALWVRGGLNKEIMGSASTLSERKLPVLPLP